METGDATESADTVQSSEFAESGEEEEEDEICNESGAGSDLHVDVSDEEIERAKHLPKVSESTLKNFCTDPRINIIQTRILYL